MQTMLSPLRDALLVSATDAAPQAEIAGARPDPTAAMGAPLPEASLQGALDQRMPFRVRELTLHYEAFASAARHEGAAGGALPKGPDIQPRTDLDDGDGSGKQPRAGSVRLPRGLVVGGEPQLDLKERLAEPADPGDADGDGDGTGKRRSIAGPKPGAAGAGADTSGADRFRAYDIDIMSQYRDPEVNPRADGCGTSAGGTECGGSGCGVTAEKGCGATAGCGASGCGTSGGGCGTSGACGTSAGGGCGSSGGCGTSARAFGPLDAIPRAELLRQQLEAQLAASNIKPAI